MPANKTIPRVFIPFPKKYRHGLMAFTTDRSCDFSFPSSFKFTPRQKQALKSLGLKEALVVPIKQVHGARIRLIYRKAKKFSLHKADGAITDCEGVALAVRTADCLPIFLWVPKKGIIGLVHAGWKGTQKHIAARAIRLLKTKWHVKPKDIFVAFGPSIQKCCYEVGEEFQQYFANAVIRRHGKFYLNLPVANYHQIIKEGVAKNHIFKNKWCTSCQPQFFSYRREGIRAGRMLSVIMRKHSGSHYP